MTVTTPVNIGPLHQIPPGEGRAFDIAGAQVAVFHLRNGDVRAVGAACTHRGGPIADGQIDNNVVICPLHLNTFDLATGCSLSGVPDLPSYRVSVDGSGDVIVDPVS